MSDHDDTDERGYKAEAFSGCHQHGQFDYYCHACLVATVATLCGMLDADPRNVGLR